MPHELAFAAIDDRINSDGGEAFWLAIRGNISKLSETADWHEMVYGQVIPVIADEDRGIVNEAAIALPDGVLDETTWKSWTSGLKETTGRKGKGLFTWLFRCLWCWFYRYEELFRCAT